MKKLLIALMFSFVSTGAYADGHSPCNVTDGTINVLANEFTTLRIVMEEAEKCAGSDADFSVTHSVDHQKLQGPALEANPAEFTAEIVISVLGVKPDPIRCISTLSEFLLHSIVLDPSDPTATSPDVDPALPSLPAGPGTPGIPSAPSAPDAPGFPGAPGSPGSPGAPGSPDIPGSPGSPGAPAGPAAPAGPVAPAHAYMNNEAVTIEIIISDLFICLPLYKQP